LLIVLGGGIGYAFLKGCWEPFIKLFGDGAVYFGWIGSHIGLIAITGGRFDTWGDIEKMGPALAVAMLTLFHGYMALLIAKTFTPLTSSED
jgi:flagellar motor component MotA